MEVGYGETDYRIRPSTVVVRRDEHEQGVDLGLRGRYA